MRNILLTLEYDGTNYHGWQVQKNARSIQSLLEEALATILREPVKVTAAGRTDAGVHALGQVVNFRTESDMRGDKLFLGVNALLPEDIVVKDVEEVAEDFDARRDAKSKTYRYVILNTKAPTALYRNRAWHVRAKLDTDLMLKAARMLLGKHDFSSFRGAGCASEHAVRKMLGVRLFRGENPYDCGMRNAECGINTKYKIRNTKYDFIIFEIEGQAFLKHMVRNIVGTLVALGSGKITLDDFKAIVDARDRTKAGVTAPPQGLYLVGVKY